jgi:AraC-like DNA-binding protein
MSKQTTRTPTARPLNFGLSEEHPILVMNQHTTPSDAAVRFDMHYALEMGIVLEGTMMRHTGGSECALTAGEMWFCGMWEPHGYQVDGTCRRVVIAIWPPALLDLRFPELRELHWMRPFVATPEHRPSIPPERRCEVVELVRRHLGNGGKLSAGRKRLLVMELLIWLSEHDLLERATDHTPQPPELMMQITPAIDLAFRDSELITNTAAARACGLSRDIFIRSFRSLMGVSFRQFAVRHRLSKAAEALLKTDHPIKAIAHEWGFTDTSHLHRLFKQHYGCTPLDYRRSSAALE